jgi:hypothetical protein
MAADALVSLVTLVLFACLFYGPWQAVCTDWARQLIFEKRDHLFDLAAQGKLDFASAEYRTTRKLLEGMIRFAHILTWPRLVMAICFRHHSDPGVDKMITRIEDPVTRERVSELVFEASTDLLAMIALKSIFVAPIAFVVCVVAVCSSSVKSVLRRLFVPGNLTTIIEEEARLA